MIVAAKSEVHFTLILAEEGFGFPLPEFLEASLPIMQHVTGNIQALQDIVVGLSKAGTC